MISKKQVKNFGTTKEASINYLNSQIEFSSKQELERNNSKEQML